MPNTLFIRPNQVHQIDTPTFEWGLYDLTGEQVKYGSKSTLELIDQTLMQNGIENVEVIGLWPAYATFSSKISLPGNQSRLIQQALPFAVEEQIAQDIEQVHIALGGKNKASEYSVLNIDYALFEAYFKVLTTGDLAYPLKAIHLDANLLPIENLQGQAQAMTLCLSSREVVVNQPDGRAISLAHANLIPYLDSIFLGQAESPLEGNQSDESSEFKLHVYIEKAQLDQSKMLIAQIEQYPGVKVSSTEIEFSEFELLCIHYFKMKAPAIDLCQGDFKLNTAGNNVWGRWRSVAAIAVIGLLLQLGVFIGQGVFYNQQADKIGQQVLAQYKKIVPNSRKVTLGKLPRIIKGKLNNSNAASNSAVDFLSLLGEAGYQFKNSKHNSQLKFKSINYNEQRGELLLEMQAQSFEQLELLKQSIVSAGLTAKIISNVQEKAFVRGRISVSGA